MWFLLTSLALADPAPLEEMLASQMDRAMAVLSKQEDAPYYLSLSVEDWSQVNITGRAGTVQTSSTDRSRYLDIDLRVGEPALDSTHDLRGFSALEGQSRSRTRIPIDDDYALNHTVWRELDQRYRDAAERIVVVRANQIVKVEEEDPADDFESREGVVDHSEVPELSVDVAAWEAILTDVSARLEQHSFVHSGRVSFSADRVLKTFVDTESTRLVHGRLHARVSLNVSSTADDGDIVHVFESRDVHDPSGLPGADILTRWADEALVKLDGLRKAPRGEPYSGPVMLRGRAAGVFFHEVLGHRVEGHRQKHEYEGKTFAEYVGEPILPDYMDIYDDPTVREAEGVELNGFYSYDDEGVAAARAPLVEDGVFVGFLMGRSPIAGFGQSNGHGRRSAGNPPTSRMGNTIIETAKPLSEEAMRKLLMDQIRAQDLEYAYIIEDIDGGFTLTGRTTPNAFNVRASTTWRVYADGRDDELVRGIDLVGTPLVAFGSILGTGAEREVFNGVCGAESGWVPVSAVSPSLVFSKLEFQLKEKSQERPPLLEKPTLSLDGSSDGGGP